MTEKGSLVRLAVDFTTNGYVEKARMEKEANTSQRWKSQADLLPGKNNNEREERSL